jgi:hypothetical protein
MRLLLVIVVLCIAPAGALIVTERYVGVLEGDFWADAASQITRLDRITALYPPNVRKMKTAPAILQLKQMTSAQQVAATVCAVPDSPYQRLFDRITTRCTQWTLYRSARRAALLAALVTVATFALILMARITVRRYAAIQQWPGNWNLWFVVRGLPVLLLGQIATSLFGYGVLLQSAIGKTTVAIAMLLVPFAVLFWLERRLVLAFVEPEALAAFRPKHVSGGRRSRVSRST